MSRVNLNDFEDYENITFIKKNKRKSTANVQLQLKEIFPLTENQSLLFNSYNKGYNIVASGSSGTGKSFLFIYLMFKEIFNTGNYEKIIIYRTPVQTRSMGFTPGNEKEKIDPYINGIIHVYKIS